MKMGDLIDSNPQIKQLEEKYLSKALDIICEDEDIAYDLCDEMDITEDEMWWMFE